MISAPARLRRVGALTRPLTPSAELAAIIGDEPFTRTEMVKRVWTYIKAHRLQDPADGRVILPAAEAALREWIVSRRVNRTGVGDDDPTLLNPVEETA